MTKAPSELLPSPGGPLNLYSTVSLSSAASWKTVPHPALHRRLPPLSVVLSRLPAASAINPASGFAPWAQGGDPLGQKEWSTVSAPSGESSKTAPARPLPPPLVVP